MSCADMPDMRRAVRADVSGKVVHVGGGDGSISRVCRADILWKHVGSLFQVFVWCGMHA